MQQHRWLLNGGERKSPNSSGRLHCKRTSTRKTPSPILSISDTLQTVSERGRARWRCACTPNGAGSDDGTSARQRAQPMGGRRCSSCPITEADGPKIPPPPPPPPEPSVDSALNKTTVWVKQFIALRCGSLTAAYSQWENGWDTWYHETQAHMHTLHM